MSKAVLIFLIFIILLGIFGKLRLPLFPKIKRNSAMSQAKKCKECGSYMFKDIDCSCKTKS